MHDDNRTIHHTELEVPTYALGGSPERRKASEHFDSLSKKEQRAHLRHAAWKMHRSAGYGAVLSEFPCVGPDGEIVDLAQLDIETALAVVIAFMSRVRAVRNARDAAFDEFDRQHYIAPRTKPRYTASKKKPARRLGANDCTPRGRKVRTKPAPAYIKRNTARRG